MNKYEEYSNKIKDIEYILGSNYIDIIDYQYVLVLIYESIYNISEELCIEIKSVLNKITFNIDCDINSKFLSDIQNKNTYIYLLNLIKNDLNQYNIITDNVKNNIIHLLNLINNSIESLLNSNNDNNNDGNNNCSHNCSNCEDNNTIAVQNNYLPQNKIMENKIFENKYLNKNYIKDYYLNNKKLKNECAICGLVEWQNNYLQMHLDFIDGNFNNQSLENLRLLCPNCFSQVGHHE